MYNEIMKFVELNKEKSATITDAEYFVSCFVSDKEELRINNLIEFETERTLEIKVDALLDRLSSYVYEKTNINLNFILCKSENVILFSCFKSELTAKEKIKEQFVFYLVTKFYTEIKEKGWSLVEYSLIELYFDSQYPSKYFQIDKEEEMALLMVELVCYLSPCFELNYEARPSGLFLEKKVRKSA